MPFRNDLKVLTLQFLREEGRRKYPQSVNKILIKMKEPDKFFEFQDLNFNVLNPCLLHLLNS